TTHFFHAFRCPGIAFIQSLLRDYLPRRPRPTIKRCCNVIMARNNLMWIDRFSMLLSWALVGTGTLPHCFQGAPRYRMSAGGFSRLLAKRQRLVSLSPTAHSRVVAISPSW